MSKLTQEQGLSDHRNYGSRTKIGPSQPVLLLLQQKSAINFLVLILTMCNIHRGAVVMLAHTDTF